MTTTKQILKAINCPNLDLIKVQGHGYFYYAYDDMPIYETESVYCNTLSQMSLEKWVEAGHAFLKTVQEKHNL